MLKEAKIINQNNEGMGIAKIENKITFIPFTLKDEIVTYEIVKENKKYNEGRLVDIKKEAGERQIPKCKYYYKCGGCNLMHQKYYSQLEFKKRKVINNLKHIANIEIENVDIIYDNEFNYRNHITLSVNKNNIGFYQYHTNKIINIEECLISNEKINQILKEIINFINIYPENNIERISIKAYNEILINIESKNFKLIDEFKKYVHFDSLYINNNHVLGKKEININLNKYTYKVSATAFFQKNTNMTIKLYNYVKDLLNKEENILDLYCGSGGIGIYVSKNAKNVLGIEVIKEAVINAKENSKLNNIKNISFINGKVEDNLENIKNINTIILDPPRVGLNKKAIENVIKINAQKLIYISCNSVTLSRDLNYLKEKYELISIRLFDLFPNTHHVECVALLSLKNQKI